MHVQITISDGSSGTASSSGAGQQQLTVSSAPGGPTATPPDDAGAAPQGPHAAQATAAATGQAIDAGPAPAGLAFTAMMPGAHSGADASATAGQVDQSAGAAPVFPQ